MIELNRTRLTAATVNFSCSAVNLSNRIPRVGSNEVVLRELDMDLVFPTSNIYTSSVELLFGLKFST
jgi:hypothetical protein